MVIEPQASSTLLPSQQQLLLRIQHQATLESNLILVSGRSGAGKYTIASALLEQYESEFSLAWLTCHEKSTTDGLRQQLLTQLLPQSADESSLSLHQHLSRQGGTAPLRWLIVVNQAELMGNPLLVELWGLVEHCRQHPELNQQISIVLFAEPGWSHQVGQEMHEVTGSELPMLQVPAISLAERKQLFVQLQARLEGNLLDVELNERILNEQEGLPGEVVALFDTSANHRSESEDDAQEPVNKSWLVANKWLWLLLALIPATVILWWANNGSDPVIQGERRPAPAPDLIKPDVSQLTPKQESKPAEPVEPAKHESLPEAVTQITLTANAVDESHKQRVEVDEQALKLIVEKVAETEVDPLPDETPRRDEGEVNQERLESMGGENLKPASPSPSVGLNPEVVSDKPEPLSSVEQESEPKPWWQQLSEQAFVLQLVLMSSEQGILNFASQHGLEQDPEFRHYPAVRNGKQVYIGVYGDFSSKELARAEAQRLKSKHANLNPWPKSAKAVQQEAQTLD